MAANSGDGTGALEKAMDVLDAISAAPEGLSQGDLADTLGLPRTTTYRLLATLVSRGMVRRDPLRKVYCLGFRCFEMARQAHAQPDLVAAAALEMRALRDLTGETTYLAMLEGLEVISLERCDGAHSQRSAAVLGQRKPLHCTSQGKAILSALPAERRDALVRELPMKALTPLTLTDRRRLQAELRVSAARGYAVDDEEIVLGVRCVGAPIVDGRGQVRGALSVAGPAYRLTRERLELLGPEVAEAARRVGAQLASLGGASEVASEAQVLDGDWAFWGAHPVWMPGLGALWWSDVLAPSVRAQAAGRDRLLASLDGPVRALVRRGEGADEGAWVFLQDAVWSLDGAGGLSPAPLAPPEALLAVCAEADGRLWAAVGDRASGCSIGWLDEAGRVRAQWRLREPVQALAWGAAGLHATVPDSGAVYLLRPGSESVRRLTSVPKGSGRVSGLAVDPEGGFWVALTDGWSVMRFLPDGALDRVVGLPVPCPTGMALGGAEGRTLYITTARHTVALDTLGNAPLSGRLFGLPL